MHSRAALTSLLSVILMTLAPAARSAAPSQASEGEHIAREVCSACHLVASSQERPPILKGRTPSFCEVANAPTTSTRSLAHFVLTTHWDENASTPAMPNPMLNKDQASAVSRYILGLKGHCSF